MEGSRQYTTSLSIASGAGLTLLESARISILNEEGVWNERVIVAGRRQELTESDKTQLSAFNQADVRVKVRTYDWLIAACVSAEKKSMPLRGTWLAENFPFVMNLEG